MHFNSLRFVNIKGRCGQYEIGPLCIVSGPNGSGKSAFLEALRLAATGKCASGGTGRAQSRIVSGDAAMSSATTTAGNVLAWQLSAGDTVSVSHEGDVLQGGMPCTVEGFWDLTAEQRLALVGGQDALEKNAKESDLLKAKLKELSTVINAPGPRAPKPYDGPPEEELSRLISETQARIDEHTKAQKCDPSKLAQIDAECLRLSQDIADSESALAALERERDEALPLFSAYTEAIKKKPSILNGHQTVNDWLGAVVDALVWLREGGSDTSMAIESIRHLKVEGPIMPVFFERSAELYSIAGPAPDVWLIHIEGEASKLSSSIVSMKSRLESLRTQRSYLLKDGQPKAMSTSEFSECVLELERLKAMHMHALEWHTFGKRSGDWAVERSEAVAAANHIEQKLSRLRDERAEIINEMKVGVEDAANAMLSKIGAQPLSISVSSTAKRLALSVEVGGVDIAALAASERLVYGLCLLSVIQQRSGAECPILVAECAEMDGDMFARAVNALGTPKKGNLVLEHWNGGGIEGSIVMGGAS